MTVQKREIFADINITPLTDIFLVLLIIMMVVAPMLEYSGIKMDVPSVGPSADVKEQPNLIIVKVTEQNTIEVDGQITDPVRLASTLSQLKQEKPDGVIIQTHPDATHETLTTAMDAAQVAQITKVAVNLTPTGENGAMDQ